MLQSYSIEAELVDGVGSFGLIPTDYSSPLPSSLTAAVAVLRRRGGCFEALRLPSSGKRRYLLEDATWTGVGFTAVCAVWVDGYAGG